MNKTIFIAAMLAVATVLAAGLTVLPSAVQEAQANPCAIDSRNTVEGDIDSDAEAQNNQATVVENTNDQRECNFGPGPIEIDED